MVEDQTHIDFTAVLPVDQDGVVFLKMIHLPVESHLLHLSQSILEFHHSIVLYGRFSLAVVLLGLDEVRIGSLLSIVHS